MNFVLRRLNAFFVLPHLKQITAFFVARMNSERALNSNFICRVFDVHTSCRYLPSAFIALSEHGSLFLSRSVKAVLN
jgi:hypothetical protein